MPVYSITCPECRATLKSSKPVPAGQVLECPKCRVMFAAPASKPVRPDVVDDVEVIDDVDVIDDVEVVDDAAPARRATAKAGSRKPAVAADPGFEVVDDDDGAADEPRPKRKLRPKSKSGGNKGVLIGLLVGGALLVLGGGGALAWWLLAGGSGDEPLAYVPADSQIAVRVDGQALFNSPLGSRLDELLNSPFFGALTRYKTEAHVSNRDILQRLAVGVKTDNNQQRHTVVLKSETPWDAEKLGKAFSNNAIKQEVAGHTAYRVPFGGTLILLVVPGKKTALISDMAESRLEPLLKAAGRKSNLTGDMALLAEKAAGSQLWAAMVLDETNRNTFMAGFNSALAANPAAQSATSPMQQAKGLGIWMKLDGDQVGLNMGFLMPDAGTAQQFATSILPQGAKPVIDPATKAMLAFLPATVKSIAEEAINSAQAAANGSMTVLSVKLSTSSVDTLLGELAKQMAMASDPSAQPVTPVVTGTGGAAPPRGGPPAGNRGGGGKGGGGKGKGGGRGKGGNKGGGGGGPGGGGGGL